MKAKQWTEGRLRQMVRAALLVNLWILVGLATASAADPVAPVRIVAFGDSLTAGYMLPPKEAFPYQLEQALKAKGYAVEVTNAGVSGDTTSGGLARLAWSVPEGTDAVILELGANDGLRGLDLKVTRHNLETILQKLDARNVEVLLAGMKLPRSIGAEYEAEFERIYADLARTPGIVSYPFFLDGVVEDPALRLEDGLHPTGKAVGIIVQRILPKVEELIARVKERRSRAASRN